MTSIADEKQKVGGLAPFSLKDAATFIEGQFPVGRISAEAYKERSAVQGQLLTTLGTYWKGRKPLILVRAIILGCLLPSTNDPLADLDIFLQIMAMDDAAFAQRYEGNASEFSKIFPNFADLITEERGRRRLWREDVSEEKRFKCINEAFSTLPYPERLNHARRPEEIESGKLLHPIWGKVNKHLGTTANSLPVLVEQLGIARFGKLPKIADTFCGGGSIPFEAARVGCNVYASDLNPIACMLTWGAFNVIGASKEVRSEIERAQKLVSGAVDDYITDLGIEHSSDGRRAKAYLYCLETKCPRTGWMVPMVPTWIISKTRNVIGKLIPDHNSKCYKIEIHSGVSAEDLKSAEMGTVRDGRLIHPMNAERSGVELKTIRGDYKDEDGTTKSRLRLWEKEDFTPRSEDIFQERLYCIQWITNESLAAGRRETYFAAVTQEDLEREKCVELIVRKNISDWQRDGLIPDMKIAPGDNTTQPIRERGWTYWHHLFSPRNLLFYAILGEKIGKLDDFLRSVLLLSFSKTLDWGNKLCYYGTGAARESISHLFSNQAFNTFINYGIRGASGLLEHTTLDFGGLHKIEREEVIRSLPADKFNSFSDIFITDPPYADSINYHEITEFFIAWLRRNPPSDFKDWVWDSQRNIAIKGRDEEFRREMVAAYSAMTRRMPENGIQVVMFTHQDPGVWADLGAILWASGLRATSAWNIVTETPKPGGIGNYVQGTVCLVLRKRTSEKNARRMEIESEIELAVSEKLTNLNALDEAWPSEALYTDGDLTLAAYAAALQVVTGYSTIDRQPLDRDLYRKLGKGERSMIRDFVEYAAQIANGLLVPTDFPRDMWRDLLAPERFYVRMLDMEAKGSTKVADFQNFARTFAFNDYTSVMSSTAANAAALAGALDLKGSRLDGDGFFATQLRQVLFAIWKTMEKNDPKIGVTTLRTEYSSDYWQRRQKLIALAAYVSAKTSRTRPAESAAAHELAEALTLDRA